ncbi:hypothetical protein KIN20_006938 [Parelaphostrongylus tenuis]|uniref:Uncharacterized protein n=1 Tax=Parelaphostrongylus tenuis TaxID=148309 RepID=A0AAD5MKU0_PARTN|nr:hypothetical protein KIN20_006938 [Parelaphostrongylus tenuis]
MNNSLSGNEKLLSLSNAIGPLPRDYRRLMEEFLNREATATQATLKTVIKDAPRSSKSTESSTDPPRHGTNQNSKPFAVHKDVNQFSAEHGS